MPADTVSSASFRRTLIEGALVTLRDPEANKAAAIQTAAIVANGGRGSVKLGTAEPDASRVDAMIVTLEEMLAEIGDGTDLDEAKLSEEERKALPQSDFVFPEDRRYPIHDKAHARAALQRVAQHGTPEEKAKVHAAVKRRYPGIHIQESVDLEERAADAPPNADMHPAQAPPANTSGVKAPQPRGNERKSGGSGHENPVDKAKAEVKAAGKGEAGSSDFEKLHPRGRGGVWIKKGQGTTGAPSPPVAQLQRRLVQLGYGPGAPDGKMGGLTQAAVSKFQTDYGLQATGEVDPATAQMLASPPPEKLAEIQARNKQMAALPNAQGQVPGTAAHGGTTGGTTHAGTAPTSGTGAAAVTAGAPAGADHTTLDTSDPEAVKKFQQFHGLKVDGVVGPETTNKMNEVNTASADGKIQPSGQTSNADGTVSKATPNTGTDSSSSSGSPSSSGSTKSTKSTAAKSGKNAVVGKGAEGPEVKAVQTLLDALGYDLGKYGVDGYFGGSTEQAVRKIQREHGLRADGKVGRRTVRLLKRLAKSQQATSKDKSHVRSGDEIAEAAHVESLRRRLIEAEQMLSFYERAGDVNGVIATRAEAQVYRERIEEALTKMDPSKIEVAPPQQARRHAPRPILRESAAPTETRHRRNVATALADRFDAATASRLVAQESGDTAAFLRAQAEERLMASRIVEEAQGSTDFDLTQARAINMLGVRSTSAAAVLREAEDSGNCPMPHAAMSKKGMRKCPKCGKKIGEIRKTVEEASVVAVSMREIEETEFTADEHRAVIRFMLDGEHKLIEARADHYDSLPGFALEEVKSSAYPGLERKAGGPDNWVEKAGGLPSYIERIAKHLHYEKKMDISRAIAVAVNVVKKACASGQANASGQWNPKSRAEACKAVAEWERKKGSSKAKSVSEASWNPTLHPRDREGHFRDVLATLQNAVMSREKVHVVASLRGGFAKPYRVGEVKSFRGGGSVSLIDARQKLTTVPLSDVTSARLVHTGYLGNGSRGARR